MKLLTKYQKYKLKYQEKLKGGAGHLPTETRPASTVASFLSPRELYNLSLSEKKQKRRFVRGNRAQCEGTFPFKKNCRHPHYKRGARETIVCCNDQTVDLNVVLVHWPEEYYQTTTHRFSMPVESPLSNIITSWSSLPGLDRHQRNVLSTMYLNYDASQTLRSQTSGGNPDLITINDLHQPLMSVQDTHGNPVEIGNDTTIYLRMATWTRYNYDPDRGWDCLAGNGLVRMQNGKRKYVRELKVGDTVSSLAGWSVIDKVFCYPRGDKKLCNLRGVTLTHKHPVYLDGEWQYPKDTVKSFTDNQTLYNFQMRGDRSDPNIHSIIVGQLPCATLGCGPSNLRDRNPESDHKYGSGYWLS